MSVAPNLSKPTPLPAQSVSGLASLRVADLFLLVSVGLWALGVSQTKATTLGPYGLPAALPIVFYAGVALVVVSAGIELARGHPSGWRMSMHAVALVVMLYGTAPLVYPEGRYSWLYKTIGVVQYVNAHGHLSRHIDIYQNWPGFFALAAWFGKVAGVASPLSYAKWAQLVFELAALPLLYLIYEALSLTSRQRWVALLLYSASNWIAQDYFSPQGLGTLLCLGAMAITMRWLYVGNSSGKRRPGQAPRAVDADQADHASRWEPPPRAGSRVPFCATLVLIYLVLTFTHELSPYILAIQFGALAVARLLRPRWLPIALAAIAAGYLLPRYAYVNSHYGLMNSVGNFFSNVKPPPPADTGAVARSEQLISRCAELLSVGMWGIALIGAWLRRRSGRTVLTLVFLAYSPAAILALQAYGQEGILRVYLFSLPWTAALAASALAPTSNLVGKAKAPSTSIVTSPATRRRKLARGSLRVPLAVGIALTLFFPSFFGDDNFNRMTQTEVGPLTSFLQSAPGGPIYLAIDDAPVADTARYNLFPLATIFGSGGVAGAAPVTPDIANVVARSALSYTHGREPAYVLVTPSMNAYNQALGVTPSDSVTVLRAALARSRFWKLVVSRAGTVIYELPPTAVYHFPVVAEEGPTPEVP